MKSLLQVAQEYISLRRSLGYKLIKEALMLNSFGLFMEREGTSYITTKLALQWAMEPRNVLSAQWSSRLSVVRKFAHYAKAMDSRNEVPPYGLLPYKFQRPNPYIYRNEEILQLLKACTSLPYGNGLRRHTYYTVFGLLAVTGMRISEATALNREDVDFAHRIISIRETKFRKSRMIPLHESTIQVLHEYARLRDRIHPTAETPNFFFSNQGTCLIADTVRWTFIRLSHRIGLRKPTDSNGPRIHDMRHSFAVKTMIKWYREGVDVEKHIALLSTYLGHVKPSDTYWYLSSIPELVGLAAARLEKHLGGSI